ncbi:MAG: hypothetical protein NC431_09030 [Firmicutes bacterium]|nr:hypothetical protein [Bacillota bacterium]
MHINESIFLSCGSFFLSGFPVPEVVSVRRRCSAGFRASVPRENFREG